MNSLYIFIILLIFQIQPCECSSSGSSGAWVAWVIVFGIASCCCGACGSYYRRKRMRADAHRSHLALPMTSPYMSGSLPPNHMHGALVPVSHLHGAVVTPPQPGVYVPQGPPAYDSTNTVASYQPGGGDTSTTVHTADYTAPPAYSDVIKTPSNYDKKLASQS